MHPSAAVYRVAVVSLAACMSGATAQEAANAAAAARLHGYTRNVAVLVFEGVELLDCTGPIEAFTEANRVDLAFRVFTVAATREPLRSKNVVTIVPDFTVADCPPIDILVIPGGETRSICGDGPLARFLRARLPAAEITFSVCNGVFALVRAGCLDGLEATTHWSAIGWLREAAPKTVVHADRRVVDNGHIVTAAGVSAGIDGALHVIDRLLGRATALQTARHMEYAWQPVAAESAADDPVVRARDAWYASDWRKAGAAYAALHESLPDDPVVCGRLGVCRTLAKDLAAAQPLLELACRQQPRNALWHQFLGLLHSRQGRREQAVTALAEALACAPDNREIRQFLGLEQFATERYRESIDNLMPVWHQGGGDHGLLLKIAQAKLAVGDRDGALTCLEESAGYGDTELAARLTDARFDAVRSDPRFVRVSDIAKQDAERSSGK